MPEQVNRFRPIIALCKVLALLCVAGMAHAVKPSAFDSTSALRDLASRDERSIDLATAKLSLDRLIDPAIDLERSRREIERMVGEIERLAGGANATAKQRLTALRDYLYQAGPWNEGQPFQYDLTDPLGERLANKLLPNYLRTRRGNCVTMPMLYVILADRLGLPARLATAPHHVFVKFLDRASGKEFNLETTSGAHVARDVWYREQMPMSDAAIASGIYMRGLTRRESVALMATTVLEYLDRENRHAEALDLAEAILALDPKNIHALLSRGNAAARLAELVPPRQRDDAQRWLAVNRASFERAEQLGWEPAHESESREKKE